jgi:Holliday junction DNA helicase RuvB
VERIIQTKIQSEDKSIESNLRPQNFHDYVGQSKLKTNMKIYIDAAKKRNDVLDHVLLYGPPGLGKTTFANIIANQIKTKIKIISGPTIESVKDIALILNNLDGCGILFIDEIHRLTRAVEEILYTAMEDYALNIIIGKGYDSKNIRIGLPKFTLIGATTRAGALSAPLRDRFGIIYSFELYTQDELKQILIRSAKVINIKINMDAACEIARCSRGTPRIANRLLKRIRDFAEVKNNNLIDLDITKKTLSELGIDDAGLDIIDRKILFAIINKFNGGPVGLETLSIAIDEEPETISCMCEPYLIQLGYIQKTSRGRIATQHAYKHLNMHCCE